MKTPQKIDVKEAIAVMQAYLDGKQILVLDGTEWVECENPAWNWLGWTYKIKKEPREFWINYDNRVAHTNREDAVKPIGGEVIHVREVL